MRIKGPFFRVLQWVKERVSILPSTGGNNKWGGHSSLALTTWNMRVCGQLASSPVPQTIESASLFCTAEEQSLFSWVLQGGRGKLGTLKRKGRTSLPHLQHCKAGGITLPPSQIWGRLTDTSSNRVRSSVLPRQARYSGFIPECCSQHGAGADLSS